MNTVNILSVDFDWIMEPSIDIYNGIVSADKDIASYLNDSPGCTLTADFKKYSSLINLIGNVCRKIPIKEKVVFAIEHQEIVNTIENIWKLDKTRYNIYNVDHHHDCGYVPTLNEIYEQKLTCGNWVQYCKQLNNYTWIGNKKSEFVMSQELIDAIPQFQYCNEIQLLDYIKFDYVFICLSPQWVPSLYFPLFDVLEFTTKNLYDKQDLIIKEYSAGEIKNENNIH